MDIIKNCLCYSGGKDKILPQLLEEFPENIDNFYDVFSGSGVVSLNTQAKNYYLNDKCYQINNLLKALYIYDIHTIQSYINAAVEIFSLGKDNKEEFLNLRECYNLNPLTKHDIPEDRKNLSKYISLLCLIYYSFNHMFVFTKDDRFSVPSGYGRSSFNTNLSEKLVKFAERLEQIKPTFSTSDFKDLIVLTLCDGHINQNDLYYLDPPYFITDSTYSRTKYLSWGEDEERSLYEHLRSIDRAGVKFVLTNMLKHGDKENTYLKDFARDFNMIEIDSTYGNCSYQKKQGRKDSLEVIVKNF